MCTSLTLETADRNHLLARTMDFAFQLGTEVILYPRRYNWKSEADGKVHQTQYAFIGMGRKLEIYYLPTVLMKAVYLVRRFILWDMRSTKNDTGRRRSYCPA